MDYTSDEGEWEDFRRQLRAHGGREFRRFGLRDRGARLAAAVRTLPHRLCKSTLSCVAAMHRWWPLRVTLRPECRAAKVGGLRLLQHSYRTPWQAAQYRAAGAGARWLPADQHLQARPGEEDGGADERQARSRSSPPSMRSRTE